MDKIRGILMVVVGAFALWRGFVMHGQPRAGWAIALGVAAIGLGLFRLMRNTPARRL